MVKIPLRHNPRIRLQKRNSCNRIIMLTSSLNEIWIVTYKCVISLLGQSFWTFKYSPVHGAWRRFSVIQSMVLCSEVHLDSTENINKRSPCAPSFYYVCQNDILYRERVSGFVIYNFLYFTDICSLYSLWGRNVPPCNSKTLYVMFTDSRQESLESKVRDEISFLLGGKKKVFLTGLNELYLPTHATHCLASCLSSADAHWSA